MIRKIITGGMFATSLLAPTLAQSEDLDVFADCIEVKEKYQSANERTSAVLRCIGSLANAVGEPDERPKIGFKKPNSYGEGWSTLNTYRNFEYGMDSQGLVYLRGLMSGCPSRERSIFVLPAGFRPNHELVFSAIGGGSHERARVDIKRDGSVHFWWSARSAAQDCPQANGRSFWLSLDGIVFEGEQ